MAPLQQFSVRNRLLKVLAANDFALLQPHLEAFDLPLQQELITPNAPVKHLYFIECGVGSITADGADGRVEVGIVGCEGLVGAVPVLLCSDRTPHHHFMQIAGDALRISTETLSTAVDASPSLRRLLLRYVQTEIIQVRQTAYVNATYNLEPRLARWLLMCHDRVVGDDLRLKHEFMSMMLGVGRPGVTLALQNLEGAGRIRNTRGRVQVLSRELLEVLADGSYGQPEAEYARLIEGA